MNITPPKGYTSQYNDKIWNRGVLFVWSDVFNQWVSYGGFITVKPGETTKQALDRERRQCRIGTTNYKVFFPVTL